jgi:hypothetical protein
MIVVKFKTKASRNIKRLVTLQSAMILTALTGVCGPALGMKQAPSGWVEDEGSKTSTQQSQSGISSAGQSTQSITAGTKRVLLQGNVEHSQDLPPLPPTMNIGAIFDNKLLSAPPVVDDWYWIPDWLAGDWRRDQETVVSTHNFESGEDNRTPHTMAVTELAQFGVQRDKFGGVWHCRLATGGVADCGSYFSIALVQSQEPETVSRDKVIVRDVFTELHINKETNVIIFAAQAESLTRYEPLVDGSLKTTASVKFFDESGIAKKGQINESVETKTKQFTPTDAYKGKDLRALFKQYLLTHGKSDYIPQ